jgi:hypothetical protein
VTLMVVLCAAWEPSSLYPGFRSPPLTSWGSHHLSHFHLQIVNHTSPVVFSPGILKEETDANADVGPLVTHKVTQTRTLCRKGLLN